MFLVLLTSCNSKEKTSEESVMEKIAHAHGLENFSSAESIRYTFNVRVNDSLRTSRSWQWKPRTNEVSLITADSTITYDHKQQAESFAETDHRFINDQYWLLFPFHLAWDDMEYDFHGSATAPISGKELEHLTVRYPDNAGYTPGDVYEVYFDENHVMREWVFKKGGSEENPFATTWEDYQEHGGMKIATMHRSEDGSFELFFSDLEVIRK